ncbi:hypothetical protein VTL71DRAFT_1885 [Oculimacula yallundae]|uniref:2EXR domain-containing protein n=1 Tax=Oculimacula yallundae TaxID=86028 RepID=A0ABR4CBZ7_9HELO
MAVLNPFSVWLNSPGISSIFATISQMNVLDSNPFGARLASTGTTSAISALPSPKMAPDSFGEWPSSDGVSSIFKSRSTLDTARAAQISSTSSRTEITRLPQLPSIFLETAKEKGQIKMRHRGLVTWKEMEELVVLFSELSLRSTTGNPGDVRTSVAFLASAMDIDFTFDGRSAGHLGYRPTARKHTSLLNNFNPKHSSLTRKQRRKAIPMYEEIRFSHAFLETVISSSFRVNTMSLHNLQDLQSNVASPPVPNPSSKVNLNTTTTTTSTLTKPVPTKPAAEEQSATVQEPPAKMPCGGKTTKIALLAASTAKNSAEPGKVKDTANDPPRRSRRRKRTKKTIIRSLEKGMESLKVRPVESHGVFGSPYNTNGTSSTESEITNTQKFPASFSTLPLELRLMIWKYARPEARVVKVSISKHNKERGWLQRFYSGAVIPNLLHVCGESRQLARQWYTDSFSPLGVQYSGIEDSIERLRGSQPIYFDQDHDFLYVACESCRGNGCYSPYTCGINLIRQRSFIKNLMFEFSGFDHVLWSPFIQYPGVENFRCVHWEKGLLFRHGARLAEFEEDTISYKWQEGKKLQDCFNNNRFRMLEDELAVSMQNVKTFSQVALQPLNTLQDILKDAEIRFTRKREM